MERDKSSGPEQKLIVRSALTTVVVVGVAGVGLALWIWRDLILLVFCATLIAVAITGLAAPIAQKTPLTARMAATCVGAGLLALIIVLSVAFGTQLSVQIDELTDRLPAAWDNLKALAAQLGVGSQLFQSGANLNIGALGDLSGLWARASGAAAAFLGGFVSLVLVLSCAAFMTASPHTYRSILFSVVPSRHHPQFKIILTSVTAALRHWMAGMSLSMLLIGTLLYLILSVLGVPSPLALAVIAAFAQLIPVIGPVVAAIPGVLLAMTVSPETALFALAGYFVISQLEANLVTPFIMKETVNLPPAVTLISVVAFGIMFGPLGLFLGIPLALLIRETYQGIRYHSTLDAR